MRKAILPLTALLVLAACGDKTGDTAATDKGPVSETVMNNVDDLQGTISDDMISIDNIRSQTPTGGDETATSETGDAASDSGVSADGSPPTDSKTADSTPADEAAAE